jgi:predicted DNA-binding protein (MmcQ/YjbR family)
MGGHRSITRADQKRKEEILADRVVPDSPLWAVIDPSHEQTKRGKKRSSLIVSSPTHHYGRSSIHHTNRPKEEKRDILADRVVPDSPLWAVIDPSHEQTKRGKKRYPR